MEKDYFGAKKNITLIEAINNCKSLKINLHYYKDLDLFTLGYIQTIDNEGYFITSK